MKDQSIQIQKPTINGLRFLIIILLVLGVFFRFGNLGRKVYWLDETFTSLRISGHLENEPVIQQLFDGRVVRVEDLLIYQRPDSKRSVIGTLKGLIVEEPQLSPLYFVILRFWTQWFGSSVAVTRSFSALISLFAFPCIYWLCRELFESSLAGWIAIALLAISPFHLLYAQEARPYSLWTVTILLSSAVLLRAMRVKTKLSWGMYGVTIAIGLYTFLFSALVAIGHGIYVVAAEGFRLSKTVTFYLLASLVGFLTFLPWLLAIIPNLHRVRTNAVFAYEDIPLLSLAKGWVIAVNRIFFDVDQGWCVPIGDLHCRYPLSYSNPLLYLILPILALVGYSIYFLVRKTPKRVGLFILTLVGVTSLALILPDLILGGQRSNAPRYLIPCLLAIQLAVVYCITIGISCYSKSVWQQKLWQVAMAVVISLGVLSCAVTSQAEVWWNKGQSYHIPPMADILNKAERPLLIYPIPPYLLAPNIGALARVMPLVHFLDPKVQFQFVVQSEARPNIPKDLNDVFVYRPSKLLKEWLEQEQNYKLEAVYNHALYQKPWLWKLAKKP